VGVVVLGKPGMALVVLSKVEQRLDAVRAVLGGATVTEVAAAVGVSRVSVHAWLRRYLTEGVSGLADRSHRPRSCPHQAGEEVVVRVAELRRTHPRWGAKRIRMELLRRPGGLEVPSTATINRILMRHGLVIPRKRKRPRSSYQRWERPGPMQLWQLDIVGGVWLVNPVTGALREVKVVTGVDDHSRFCVIAAVVERATGRAVCVALAVALARFGVPGEILTDNGKQFTARFGRGGEVLFDKICRHNGITHRLTQPASPTTTGKIERFHLTLRRELLDDHNPFESLAAAQAAIDEFVRTYNTERPHQALDGQRPVSPADRFTPTDPTEQELLPLWLPPTIAPAPVPVPTTFDPDHSEPDSGRRDNTSGPRTGGRGRGGRVRPGRSTGREPATRRAAALARPGPLPGRSCGSGPTPP
jgi:transposase InsO family protein